MEEEFERGRGRENSGGLLVALLQRVEEAREEGGVAAAAALELLRGDVDARVVSGVAMPARKAACARVKASLGRRLTVRRLLKTASRGCSVVPFTLENRGDSHGCGEELPPFELLIAAGLAELRAQRLRRG